MQLYGVSTADESGASAPEDGGSEGDGEGGGRKEPFTPPNGLQFALNKSNQIKMNSLKK